MIVRDDAVSVMGIRLRIMEWIASPETQPGNEARAGGAAMTATKSCPT
jgi:hypothetical protein